MVEETVPEFLSKYCPVVRCMVYKFEIKQAYCPIYYSCSNVEEHVLTV
jgi:hypothetical protein